MMLVRVREVDVLVARGVRFENEVFLFLGGLGGFRVCCVRRVM
jgi:hypothetical protein